MKAKRSCSGPSQPAAAERLLAAPVPSCGFHALHGLDGAQPTAAAAAAVSLEALLAAAKARWGEAAKKEASWHRGSRQPSRSSGQHAANDFPFLCTRVETEHQPVPWLNSSAACKSSAGCQVLKSLSELTNVLDISCKQQLNGYGSKFSYAVINESNLL